MAYLPNLMTFEPFGSYVSPTSIGAERSAGQGGDRTDVDPNPATDGFSALEWAVIALAERDPPSSLAVPGRLSLAMGSLFGTTPNPRLADPRLEGLRRFAVLAWQQGYALPSAEFAAFRAAGFMPGQIETLLGSVARRRAQRDRFVA